MLQRASAVTKKIQVLIVDDSAAVRKALSSIISSDDDLEVMATASDPFVAVDHIKKQIPDVILLDIEMPRMDGITFLKRIMAQKPIPVVICSSLTEAGSHTLMEALEAGAVDVVTKPRVDTAAFLQESAMRICDATKAASQARLKGLKSKAAPPARPHVEAKLTADAILPPLLPARLAGLAASTPETSPIACIGASTGGTEALREVLMAMPEGCPPTVIVQHMPEKFTNAFARRLNGLCRVNVKEAEDGDLLQPGLVLIAPGNHHMVIRRTGTRYNAKIVDGPHVSRHRPSVDVLFRSAAQNAAQNAIGILLTGMGDDGAKGLLEMKTAGAHTVAQDEESCVVFGMPKEAIAIGAALRILPLKKVVPEIVAFSKKAH